MPRFLSVGAGHEHVLYWLANHVRRVVATDMYEGVWQDERAREGDPAVLDNPDQYAPFPYRRDHLEFMRMDGRSLKFPDDTFDVSYSLSSIEHFGGLEGAGQTHARDGARAETGRHSGARDRVRDLRTAARGNVSARGDRCVDSTRPGWRSSSRSTSGSTAATRRGRSIWPITRISRRT